MALHVEVPDELAKRLEAVAAARHESPERVALEAIEQAIGAVPAPARGDALEAFIGSGDSDDPDWAERDTHELRAEAAARRTAP